MEKVGLIASRGANSIEAEKSEYSAAEKSAEEKPSIDTE